MSRLNYMAVEYDCDVDDVKFLASLLGMSIVVNSMNQKSVRHTDAIANSMAHCSYFYMNKTKQPAKFEALMEAMTRMNSDQLIEILNEMGES